MLQVTDGELDALVASPAWADVVRTPAIVFTAADGSSLSRAASERLAAAPCIVIGTAHDPARPPAHVDTVVDPAVASFDDLVATIDRAPIAATALAVLLRAGPHASTGAGLAAESAVYSTLQAGPEFAAWRAARAPRVRRPDDRPAVRLGRNGGTLEVTLDRPAVRNSLNVAMREGLLAAFDLAAADPSIDHVVVRGSGASFSTGGDLDEFGTFEDPASAHLVRLATSVGLAIDRIRARVTVELHGPCAGSGIELPAFAGRVVADPGTTLSLPELALGLVPGAGGTVGLVRRAGRHRVALLAYCGRAIDAPTAHAWGLVDEIRGSRPSP